MDQQEINTLKELTENLMTSNLIKQKDCEVLTLICERQKGKIAELTEEVSNAYNNGATDAATKILHYMYPLWQDATSKNVAIGSCVDRIKATFGV